MPDAAWHEVTYQSRDQRLLPLEPGHRFFLSEHRVPKRGTLLDVGCGTGNFLAAAKAAGFDVAGIELDHNAAQFARQQLRLQEVHGQRLEEFIRHNPQRKFDVVTFFEVLEHQDKPCEFVGLIKACLKDGGYIGLSVPNRERWQKGIEVLDYPPNHLTRWNAPALRNFFAAQGFDVVAVHEEPVRVRRGAEVLSMALRTGMVSTIAGENPPTPTNLAEMRPEDMAAAVRRVNKSLRHRLVSKLVAAKQFALLPVAFLGLPYFRWRDYKGLYLCCIAKISNRSQAQRQE